MFLRDLGHPAEPEPRHGADRALTLAVVADRPPRPQHHLRELRVGYVRAAEDRLHQLVAIDRAIAMLDQATQALEDAGGQRDGKAVAPQLMLGEIEDMIAEAIADGRHGYRGL
jgi:hypothetical protein